MARPVSSGPDPDPRLLRLAEEDNVLIGAHMILFTTGRGSVVGSAISPIVKVCANPETYARMADDMDVDAGRVIEGRATLEQVGDEIMDLVLRVAAGRRTASEEMGHQEFVLTYKSFEPVGPACLPLVAGYPGASASS